MPQFALDPTWPEQQKDNYKDKDNDNDKDKDPEDIVTVFQH